MSGRSPSSEGDRGRREVTATNAKVKRARDLKAQGLTPADIGKIIGASRATVYRYLSIGSNELL